jgi:hypothetical protein
MLAGAAQRQADTAAVKTADGRIGKDQLET